MLNKFLIKLNQLWIFQDGMVRMWWWAADDGNTLDYPESVNTNNYFISSNFYFRTLPGWVPAVCVWRRASLAWHRLSVWSKHHYFVNAVVVAVAWHGMSLYKRWAAEIQFILIINVFMYFIVWLESFHLSLNFFQSGKVKQLLISFCLHFAVFYMFSNTRQKASPQTCN